MALRELFHDAAGSVAAPPTEHLTTAVTARLRRRTMMKATGTGALSIAVVGAFGTGYLALRPAPPAPLPAAGSPPVALRTDRALALGSYTAPKCNAGRCVPILTTVDGRRYTLPGPVAKHPDRLAGVGLSPDGRWLVYNQRGEAQLRDLTGTTTYHVRGSGNRGSAYGWSSNGRWALIQPISHNRDGSSGSTTPIRVDLSTGKQIVIRTPKSRDTLDGFFSRGFGSRIALLPSGDLLLGAPGAKPTTPPPAWGPSQSSQSPKAGPGTYRVVDPATGAEKRRVTVQDAVHWAGGGLTRNGHTTAKWNSEMTDVHARSDGRYAAFSFVDDPTVRDSGLLVIADLSNGSVRTVDVAKLARRAGLTGPIVYSIQSYTGQALTLLTQTGQIVLDGNAERVTAVHKMPKYPEHAIPPGYLTSLD